MLRYLGFSRSLLRKFGTLVVACGYLLFLLLFVNRAWADENMPNAPGSIAGIVTNGITATRLDGIEIVVFQQVNDGGWQQIRALLTDANGGYKANLLGAGVYRILASDPKGVLAQTYYAGATVLEAATDIPVAGVNVTNINLQLGVGGGITGTITSTLPPSPIEGNNYTVLRVFQKVGTKWGNVRTVAIFTDQKVYSLTGLPTGVYRVCTGNGYPLNSYDPNQDCYANVYAIDNGLDVTVTAGAITPNINFILGDGADLAQIVGNVADTSGKPLAKVNVSAQRISTSPYGLGSWAQYTKTNSTGTYQLPNLLPGSYIISFFVVNSDYVSEIYSDVLTFNQFSIAQATPVTVLRNETRSGIDANLAPASYVSGRLMLDGAPLQQPGSVAVDYKSANGWTSFSIFYGSVDPSTGRYKIGGLPAGVYRLSANTTIGNAFYQGFYGGKTIEDAAPITLTVGETRTNLTIALDQNLYGTPYNAQISGTVTIKGAPVSGIKVALYQTNCCPVFPPIEPASQPAPLPTAIPDQATSRVAAIADIKPLIYAYTDAKGHYMIDGLLDGYYYLGVSDPAGVYATSYTNGHLLLQTAIPFFLQGHRVISLDGMSDISTHVELVEGGGISGRVRLKDGTGVANLAVGVFANEPPYAWGLVTADNQTDAAGNFVVKGLQAGIYHLCFGDSAGNYAVECYGAGSQNNAPEAGAHIVVLPGKITTDINHRLGPKEKTFLPSIQQNMP